MNEYCSATFSVPTDYHLQRVISHIGEINEGGHYISYIKYENRWFEFDDQMVTIISEDSLMKIIERTAYLLFYTRRSS